MNAARAGLQNVFSAVDFDLIMLLASLLTDTMYYVGAVLLVVMLIVFLVTNIFGLPGNWFNLAIAAVWMLIAYDTEVIGYTWVTLIAMLVLALIGEAIEFAASALGTSVVGGSKRSGALSLVGSLIGGVVGLFIGLPIPVVGSIVAALFFACVGSLVGAFLGEYWKQGELGTSFKVGHAAFWARLIGTLAKIFCGAAIVVLGTAALFVDWL